MLHDGERVNVGPTTHDDVSIAQKSSLQQEVLACLGHLRTRRASFSSSRTSSLDVQGWRQAGACRSVPSVFCSSLAQHKIRDVLNNWGGRSMAARMINGSTAPFCFASLPCPSGSGRAEMGGAEWWSHSPQAPSDFPSDQSQPRLHQTLQGSN